MVEQRATPTLMRAVTGTDLTDVLTLSGSSKTTLR